MAILRGPPKPPPPPLPRNIKGKDNMIKAETESSFNWVLYAIKKSNEYKKEARSFHRKGYLEVALIFAGRRMALQDMLKEGGYPENVDKDSTLV